MRALAEFIMRGRLQAAVVAFVGSLFPFISPAAVGLVALRKGPQEGLLLLIWAALPVVLLAGGELSVELIAAILQLLIMWFVSDQLRRTGSWPRVVFLTTALSGLTAILLDADVREGGLFESITVFLKQLSGEEPPLSQVLSVIGLILMMSTLVSLLLARWWQAMLYNPGGFQKEFHQLRFSLRGGAVWVIGILACTVLGEQFFPWINLLAVPLILVGIALVHWLVKERSLGLQTLVLFYIGLIVLGPLFIPMLVVIGFTDSIVDLRSRLKNANH